MQTRELPHVSGSQSALDFDVVEPFRRTMHIQNRLILGVNQGRDLERIDHFTNSM
jgi:hypothetical protein